MDDRTNLLANHPVFNAINAGELSSSLPSSSSSFPSLTSSSAALRDRGQDDSELEEDNHPGRKQTMVLHETDLFVACGSQIRVASLASRHLSSSSSSSKHPFKTLHTPNLSFQIHELALSPTGKLLAIAGTFQVAVLVLPRGGFTHLVPSVVDCKLSSLVISEIFSVILNPSLPIRSVQVGPAYHASKSAVPIAKIAWHPWGEAGSTLMVMTVDGKMREYDVSMDPLEPCQELSFFPSASRRGSYIAQDESERMVASFTLGKGRADWGPLTLYALTRSGDIHAICPYLPHNAAVPANYLYALECFISQKQEVLAEGTSAAAKNLSTVYDYQRKYVTALIKQLPASAVLTSPQQSRFVAVHPPSTIRVHAARQGPFCLKPCPKDLVDIDGFENEATDLFYVASDESFLPPADGQQQQDQGEQGEEAWDIDNIGILLIAFKDGRVDLCLDVEKIEARWEGKEALKELPMLLVHESIDLGLVTTLQEVTPLRNEPPMLSQLVKNHPVLYQDPIHDGVLYVYHAFGVHSLNTWPLLARLRASLQLVEEDSSSSLEATLRSCPLTEVVPMLSTFSVERRFSTHVTALVIPDDIYLNYSILVLTSAMRITCFPLSLRPDYGTYHQQQEPEESSAAPGGPSLGSFSASVSGGLSASGNLSASTSGSFGTPSKQSSKWLTPAVDQPLPYLSLLGQTPYSVPPILSRAAAGLPANPRLSHPPAPPTSSGKDFVLTPDTLRYLGGVVSSLRSQIQQVQMAQQQAESRAMLQQQEVGRMCKQAGEMVTLVGELMGPRRDRVNGKVEKVLEEQKDLLGRMERILRGIMMKASPELNESEKKWFDELARMKREVMGVGKWDDQSLVSRTRVLKAEFDRVLPLLNQMQEKEKRQSAQSGVSETLGVNQAFELGNRSEEQQSRIRRLEKMALDLSKKVDVDAGVQKSN